MNIPRDKTADSSLMLLLQGYRFLPSRFQRHRSDIFETRPMLRRVICVRGEDAAEMFYQPNRFTRHGALPPHTMRLLSDKGSAQMQEDEDHRHRKAMFMELMTRERIEDLLRITSDEWRSRTEEWSTRNEIVLLDEVELLLCRAVCSWAGVPLNEHEAQTRTSEFSAMITGAGGVGPTTWKALFLRQRTERWGRGVIREIRGGKRQPPESSAAYVIVTDRNLSGELLPVGVAGVELINILRPTVAVAGFIAFATHALYHYPLYHYPESRRFIDSAADEETALFVQEVRRFYPFFPFIGGRVRESFDWQGHHFESGTWVMLDVYGSDRDPRLWETPLRPFSLSASAAGTAAPSTSSPREAAITSRRTAARASGYYCPAQTGGSIPRERYELHGAGARPQHQSADHARPAAERLHHDGRATGGLAGLGRVTLTENN